VAAQQTAIKPAAQPRIAIIGAGIAGLSLARSLQPFMQVRVFEKSRGVGGRMSTRRSDDFVFDHGTQFFTARTPAFQAFLQPFLDNGVVSEWSGKLVYLEEGKKPRKRMWFEPHYAAIPGMNALCRALAADLDIVLNTEVAPLGERGADGWQLQDADGASLGLHDWVISTAPVAQTLRLLGDRVPPDHALRESCLRPCHALMLGFETPWNQRWIAAKMRDVPIEWIAAGSTRPGRDAVLSPVVALSSAQWSEANIELPLADAQQQLCESFSRLTGIDWREARHVGIHRWRYATLAEPAEAEPFIDASQRIGSVGDWCSESRVESTWVAAMQMARMVRGVVGRSQ
jgi:renalase